MCVRPACAASYSIGKHVLAGRCGLGDLELLNHYPNGGAIDEQCQCSNASHVEDKLLGHDRINLRDTATYIQEARLSAAALTTKPARSSLSYILVCGYKQSEGQPDGASQATVDKHKGLLDSEAIAHPAQHGEQRKDSEQADDVDEKVEQEEVAPVAGSDALCQAALHNDNARENEDECVG